MAKWGVATRKKWEEQLIISCLLNTRVRGGCTIKIITKDWFINVVNVASTLNGYVPTQMSVAVTTRNLTSPQSS